MTRPSASEPAGTSAPTSPTPAPDGTGTPDAAPAVGALPGDLASVAAAARAAAEDAYREVARVQQVYLDAEDAFIARVAEAHRAGRIDWRAVHEAYQQVRDWSQLNGLPRFLERWQRHIPVSPIKLRELADSVPAGADQTWSGATGWDGLERGGYPPNGVHVAFVLFGNGGVPLRYGVTSRFKTRTGRMHKSEGLRWSAWQAHLARDGEDARAKQVELVARHGRPNAAVATTSAALGDAASTPLVSTPLAAVAGPEIEPDDAEAAGDRWWDRVEGWPRFVRIGATVYAVPEGPVEDLQCTGLTRDDARCRNHLDSGQLDRVVDLEVPGGTVAGYDLDGPGHRLTALGRRFLRQRCTLHDRDTVPGAVEPEWTVFDPAVHGV